MLRLYLFQLMPQTTVLMTLVIAFFQLVIFFLFRLLFASSYFFCKQLLPFWLPSNLNFTHERRQMLRMPWY